MLRTQSDARLVDLVRAGHASAFEAIVQRYRKPLLAYCSRLLPASRAEDAVQQTFLKAYQAMMSGDAELNLRPWLYRIAHNSSLNLLRQNGWHHEQLDESFDGVQRPDQAAELHERLRAAVAAVNALPERQRDAVLLREIDGLSYEEIAAALGVGDGAVRQLLHRARATLRSGLTAITPAGLVERMAAALAGGGADPTARVAELGAGFGAGAGALKLGVAVVATGVLATGAVTVPLRHHTGDGAAANEASVAPPAGKDRSSPHITQVDDHVQAVPRHAASAPHEVRHHSRSGRGPGGSSRGHSSPTRSGEGPSSPQRTERNSGSGKDGSGSDGGEQHSGSKDLSGDSGGTVGSGESPSSGDGGGSLTTVSGGSGSGSSGSGTDGSDDGQTVIAPTGTTGTRGPLMDQSGKDGGSSGDGSGGG
ncbi:MAG TPA: sigma-70 family RNA polymerase sigma factor [Thermoleophilaceae bacterium]